MAKFFDASDESIKLFNELLKSTSIPTFIKFKVLSVEKQKQLYKVSKANDVLNHLTGYDFVICLNEQLFEQLELDQQKIVLDEALAHIVYDGSSDKVSLSKPDVVTFSGIISKYSVKEYLRVKECIDAMLKQQEEKEKEKKANKKSKIKVAI